MGAYHKALHEAGFRTTDWFSDLAETGYAHWGNGTDRPGRNDRRRPERLAIRGCRQVTIVHRP